MLSPRAIQNQYEVIPVTQRSKRDALATRFAKSVIRELKTGSRYWCKGSVIRRNTKTGMFTWAGAEWNEWEASYFLKLNITGIERG